MKIQKFLAAFLVLAVFTSCLLQADDNVIVDNEFKKGEKDEPRVQDAKEITRTPFKLPSHIDAMAPSAIEFKKEGIGNYTEPVILYKIGYRPTDAKATANASVSWDFRQAKLGPKGIYEITYTIIPVELPVVGARMYVALLDGEGKGLRDSSYNISVSMNGNTVGTAHDREKVSEGKPCDVRIVVDLEKNRWSAWVNGKSVTKKEPLPEFLLNAYPVLGIGGLGFGSAGGSGDKVGGSYALGAVKVVRLSSDSD